jgi:Rrf2 family protein
MVYLAVKPDQTVSVKEVASVLNASEAHLAKVMQRLARYQLVNSVRGPRGGYMLSRQPEDIALLEVYEAIEGPLDSTNCVLGLPACDGTKCIFGGLLEEINSKVRDYFSKTPLASLISVYERMQLL